MLKQYNMVKQCDLYLYYFKVFWCNNGGCILPRLIHSLTKFENSPNLSMDMRMTRNRFELQYWFSKSSVPTVSHQKCGARKTPTHSQTWIRAPCRQDYGSNLVPVPPVGTVLTICRKAFDPQTSRLSCSTKILQYNSRPDIIILFLRRMF